MQTPIGLSLNTDLPSLKNDAIKDAVINIGAGLVVGAGSTVASNVDFTLGQVGAISRARWLSTADPNGWYSGQYHIWTRTGTVSGSPTPYNIGVFLYRIGPNILRLQILIPNPYGSTLTGAAAEQIFMSDNTFIAPFA